MSLTLSQLNALPASEAERELLQCCGARTWAREITAGRPYPDVEALLTVSDRVWWRLAPDDWLEAFAQHPRIGERVTTRVASNDGRWSEAEQARAQQGAASVLGELASTNAQYEDRFGHVFLICATGKSAEEILANARSRLQNSPERELRVAAEEQRRITHLRVRKLLDT